MLKLSKREKLLVYLFFLITIISALGLFYYLMIEKLVSVNKNIGLLETRIQQINSSMPDEFNLQLKKDLLLRGIDELQDKFYKKEEMEPYKFGILIRDLLSAKGLNIQKYQTIEAKDVILLEFSIKGNALAFAEFLEDVSLADKYLSVNSLTINAAENNGWIQAVFQITYETINEENN